MAFDPEDGLSSELRNAAVRSGNEWGWPVHLIPQVIDEAERLELVSLGGQLQFLLPAGTCECYWVSVEALAQEHAGLDWTGRVAFSASQARRQFEDLKREFDFVAEGRKAFGEHLAAFAADGRDPDQAMCFIWYLAAKGDSAPEANIA